VDLQEEASKEATEALRTLGVELKGHNQEQKERIEGLNKKCTVRIMDRVSAMVKIRVRVIKVKSTHL